jgi:DNA-binding transcriptional LysR family regulator
MAGLNPPQGAALSLRQIEVFHAVMLTGSLSEAGRMLFVTQPAVSRILASAENRLRYPLFERVKGRLHPTPEARRLFA